MAFSTPVPVHVGHDQPAPADEAGAADAGSPRGPSALEDPGIDWSRHGVEPRWLGMESSDCAAALDPSIFHNRGGAELDRFLAGTKSRDELALIVSAIGDADDDRSRAPFAADDASILLPSAEGSIGGRRLPVGGKPSLAPDLSAADRDLGLRLLTRSADAPWWSLSVRGTTMQPGSGGPPIHHEPTGQLEPILLDGLGHPVVAAWVPESGDQRWYVIPGATAWEGILDWLVEQALPTHVPNALRRARSPQALDPALQTQAEASARRALDELDADYARERRRLEVALEEAMAAAEPVRNGLLYATGAELEKAVAAVLNAAGFDTLHLDESLGGTMSADLLVTYGQERRLVEVKSASGSASESLVGQLDRHLKTWAQLRPGEPVGGGVLVVNHQHRREPDERTPEVYARAEFVAALTMPVLATRQLFESWRESDWAAIREAVLAPPNQPADDPDPKTPPAPPPDRPSAPAARTGGWRRRLGRRHPGD